MNGKYVERNCRLCNTGLETILNLGNIAVSDFILNSDPIMAPLDFCSCKGCGLIQLRHDVERDVMYKKYYYQSGLNPSMVKELKDISNRVKEYVNINLASKILDIGCNDGTFLENFECFRVGIDPAENIAEIGKKNCDIFINDYFPSKNLYNRIIDTSELL